MKDCREFEFQIALEVGGDLSPQESSRLHRHLFDCGACSRYAEGMRADLNLVRTLNQGESEFDDILLDDLRHSVMTQVGAQSAGMSSWRRFFQRLDWRYATVAVAILIVLWTSLSFLRRPSTLQRQGVIQQQAHDANPGLEGLVNKKQGPHDPSLLRLERQRAASETSPNSLYRHADLTRRNSKSMRTSETRLMAQENAKSSMINSTEGFESIPVVAQQEKTRLEIHTRDANVRIIWLLNIESKPLVSKEG